MNNFFELNLPAPMMRSLEKMQFTTPTPIQAQAIPLALQGRDILGSAQTGTGKTAAFGIPLVAHLINNPASAALVMTPTRELALQVLEALKKIAGHDIKTALLIGGENMFHQFRQIENGPRIIVGTPGRINDHLGRKSLRLNNADFLVLDETDRMLDMGFGVQIDKVLSFMPKQRQTLMFSATLPGNIVAMANKYTKNPERIAVGSTHMPIKAIKQSIIRLSQDEKYGTLTQELDKRGGSIIVFVRTKHGADRLARKLERENHSADAIHGDLRQNKRDKVIRRFREQKTRILVATDVAARGLDVPHIEHVINYDLPQCPEDYIHRIGRTARAGAGGEALCLVTPQENGKWNAIERLIGGDESQIESSGQHTPQQRQQQHQKRSNPYRRSNKSGFKKRFDKKREDRPDQRNENNSSGNERFIQPRQDAPRNDRSENQSSGGERPNNHFKGPKKEWHGKRNDRNEHPKKKWDGQRSESTAPGGDYFERPKKKWDNQRSAGSDRNEGPKKEWHGKRNDRNEHPKKKWDGQHNNKGGENNPSRSEGPKKEWHGKRTDRNEHPKKKWDGQRSEPRAENNSSAGDRPYQRPSGKKPFGKGKPWHQKNRDGGGYKGNRDRQDRKPNAA
jgi:ATP-dependent RNA helicase DeaD